MKEVCTLLCEAKTNRMCYCAGCNGQQWRVAVVAVGGGGRVHAAVRGLLPDAVTPAGPRLGPHQHHWPPHARTLHCLGGIHHRYHCNIRMEQGTIFFNWRGSSTRTCCITYYTSLAPTLLLHLPCIDKWNEVQLKGLDCIKSKHTSYTVIHYLKNVKDCAGALSEFNIIQIFKFCGLLWYQKLVKIFGLHPILSDKLPASSRSLSWSSTGLSKHGLVNINAFTYLVRLSLFLSFSLMRHHTGHLCTVHLTLHQSTPHPLFH